MLRELHIENLLLIERADIKFGSGLNVITGETGAGKTVLAHALDLIIGGKPKSGIVRPGADEAYIEGVFDLTPEVISDLELGDSAENIQLGESEIVLSRKVSAAGRTRAYAQGRSTSADTLKALGTRLIAFFGHYEHRALLRPAEQLKILDGFCGQDHLKSVSSFSNGYRRLSKLRRRQEDLREVAANREREIGILDFEIDEIEQVVGDLKNADELHLRHKRLANLESLRSATLKAAELMEPQEDIPGAAANISMAAIELDGVSGVEKRLDEIAERSRGLAYEIQDMASELRSFESSLEGDAGELTQLDERIGSMQMLFRKYGSSARVVLERLDELHQKRDSIDRADDELSKLDKEAVTLEAEINKAAGQLSRKRKRAATSMRKGICVELTDLGMPAASFDIDIRDSNSEHEAGITGWDSIEFQLAPNPGVATAQLKEAASGGELSRVMLAIISTARSQGGWPTTVFDEIDAGIGGTTANAVGRKMHQIGRSGEGDRQVLCITHLPQVAALADRHILINKETGTDVATTSVFEIKNDDIVVELCRMLGADKSDSGARKHAEELLSAA